MYLMFAATVPTSDLLEVTPTGSKLEQPAVIQLNTDGIIVTIKGENGIQQLTAEVPEDVFVEYECTGHTIALDIRNLRHLLTTVSHCDANLVQLSLNTTTMAMEVGCGTVSGECPLHDPDSDPPYRETITPSELHHQRSLSIPSPQFTALVSLFTSTSQRVCFESTGGGEWVISSNRSHAPTVDIEVPQDDSETDLTVSSWVDSKFLQYVDDAMPDETDVTIQLGDARPVAFSFTVQEASAPVDVQYLVAPMTPPSSSETQMSPSVPGEF